MQTKEQMLKEYNVLGFAMGQCIVQRKSDGVKGTLDFAPWGGVRYYYNFQEA
jgi:hypothetical protein